MALINLQNLNPKIELDLGFFKRFASKVLELMNLDESEVNVLLVTSQRIRGMNQRYFGRDKATDVIAFPANEDGFPDVGHENVFLGDIAISTDRALVNSREYSTEFREELARYIVHGLLHLTGEEDTTPDKRKKMKKKEDELLAGTGFFKDRED